MRLVIDTNLFVSAGLRSASLPALAVRMAVYHGCLLKSDAVECEVIEVLQRPKIAALVDPLYVQWVKQSLANAEPIDIVHRLQVCRDGLDDKFLELAVNGRADFLVTGDKDLLVLNPFREIPILTPAAFIAAQRV